MNSIYLHSELDLEHRGHYTPFTLLSVVLFVGVVLLFSALAFKNFSARIAPTYFFVFFVTLAYDIAMLNKVIPNGNVIFQKGFKNIDVELRVDKNTIVRGEIIDFSYWWDNQKVFLELIYENGQKVVLHETILPWESIPKDWQYKIQNFSSDVIKYPTFKVREMVKLLTQKLR